MRTLYEALNIDDPASNAAPQEPDIDFELTGVDFCRAVFESREYRESIARRIRNDSLPSAVECKLLDHAIGKPIERHEVTGKDGKAIETVKIVRVLVDPREVAEQEVDEAVH